MHIIKGSLYNCGNHGIPRPWESFHGNGIHEWDSEKLFSTHSFTFGTEACVSRCPWDFASCMSISGKSES